MNFYFYLGLNSAVRIFWLIPEVIPVLPLKSISLPPFLPSSLSPSPTPSLFSFLPSLLPSFFPQKHIEHFLSLKGAHLLKQNPLWDSSNPEEVLGSDRTSHHCHPLCWPLDICVFFLFSSSTQYLFPHQKSPFLPFLFSTNPFSYQNTHIL